jgi:hypothetical protein
LLAGVDSGFATFGSSRPTGIGTGSGRSPVGGDGRGAGWITRGGAGGADVVVVVVGVVPGAPGCPAGGVGEGFVVGFVTPDVGVDPVAGGGPPPGTGPSAGARGGGVVDFGAGTFGLRRE